jgi:membrane complex biogenesis BtpA family protein
LSSFAKLFGGLKPILGMVHLPPLPGSPSGGSLDVALTRAQSDARALVDAGFDGLIIENFGDAPFAKDSVPASTIAAMAIICREIRHEHNVPMGVNVLRNDAEAALSIATVAGADFIRVNVHVGAVVADQGILEGKARETLLLRRALGSSVLLLADVRVKHSRALGGPAGNPEEELLQEAKDAFERGKADALIVSGPSTGSAADAHHLRRIKEFLPHAPLLAGSGIKEENLRGFWNVCDGMIVGTSVKRGGHSNAEVDPVRARELVHRIHDLRRETEGAPMHSLREGRS